MVWTWFLALPKPITSKKSSNSLIPSCDNSFVNFCFNSFKSLIFKKSNICLTWSSFKSAPFVTAPDASFLSFFNNASTPAKPNPGLSNLSIALITFNCFSSEILSSLIKPWTIFLLLTLIVN